MTRHAKSRITLPPDEFAEIQRLRARVGARSNVEVVRRALRLLDAATERSALAQAYTTAAARLRDATLAEVAELDELADEGLAP